MEHEQQPRTRFRRAPLRVWIMLYGEQPDCLAWFASVDAGTATLATADRIRALNASHLLDVYELMARQSIHTGEEPSC